MSKASVLPGWQRAIIILSTTVVGVIAIACLYWAQKIFIPVALAAFLTFLLSPFVSSLQRWGLGRITSMSLVVLLAALVLGGVGWIMTREVVTLADSLPKYTDNIKGKVRSLKEMTQGATTGRLKQMIDEITREFQSKPASPEGVSPEVKKDLSRNNLNAYVTISLQNQPLAATTCSSYFLTVPKPDGAAEPRPHTPVFVQPETPVWLSQSLSTLSSVSEMLATFALTVVLLIFMLLKREDLRNRLIRLAGDGRLTVTTRAVDEAGQRISRFLMMQAILNTAYGLTVGIGLALIGVEHALLWGFLAAVLRYVPYIGVWVALLPPIVLSLAQFEGWMRPSMVIGLFVVIELVTVNFLEPRFFGKSMGVSEVALLVAAAFWAWLWGPIGLVLSSPLTVVLVVMGKYVPHLEFLDILLGDEPALPPDVTYYQRLLARDQDEAAQLALGRVKEASPEKIYDEVLIPSLNHAKRDREHDNLTEADEQYILQATREVMEDLGEYKTQEAADNAEPEKDAVDKVPAEKMHILACPARDDADRVGLEMLQQLLDPTRWDMEIAGEDMLSSEFLALAVKKAPPLICIGSLPPGGLAHTDYLCKRLKAQLPDVKLIVGRWGLQGNVEEHVEQLQEAGADTVDTTLLETRNHLNSWLPVLESMEAKSDREETANQRRVG